MLFGGLISEYLHLQETFHETSVENQSLHSQNGNLQTALEDAYVQIDQLTESNNILEQENTILQSALRDAFNRINQLTTQISQLTAKVESIEQENQRLQETEKQDNFMEFDNALLVNLPTQIMIAFVFLAGGIGGRILMKNTTTSHKKVHLEEPSDINNTAFIRVTLDEAKTIANWRRRKIGSQSD